MNVTTYRIGEVVGIVDLVEKRQPVEPRTPRLWYVLQTWPGKEAKVMRKLDDRGITAYCPRVRKTRMRRGRMVDFTEPLFAQLIFIPDYMMTDDICAEMLHFEGVEGLLTFGDWQATLPECAPGDRLVSVSKLRHVRHSTKSVLDMASVRELEALAAMPVARRRRLFKTGQLVRVVDGPFASFRGQIERLDSRGRLAVLLDIFKRVTPVVLDEGQIEAVTG
ncbi:transcription termination/antitermination protein NusG [Bradyrhizobium sp. SZCCHNS3002]|uniref:transcription termination/antitermination protein NusG n=1 Tax=Bradyrhizobium sp. SZCCHNS3002 TaxID=3057310 RepID=UPI0028E9BF24|nr:transcription termination/antitermination protein NusG [Bradyrhizobium sp. SZCCHNS3002]